MTTTPNTIALLDELKKKREAATPAPYRIHATSDYVLENDHGKTIAMLGGIDRLVQNGEFLLFSCNNSARLEAMLRVSHAESCG